jgi:predicted O-methyltransferase YrrM
MSEPLTDWIARVLAHRDLRGQGHAQRVADGNLGLGWIYYALARALRPRHVVVIGSLRGFAPLVFARALADNGDGGMVTFIDPSLVDDFWKDPERVTAHFTAYGLTSIRHYLLTTQQFAAAPEHRELPSVELLFVDGYHTAEQAKFDHEAFADRLAPHAIVLFHDSTTLVTSGIYGEERRYLHTVKQYMDELKRDSRLQVFDLPIDSGVTLVRRAGETGQLFLTDWPSLR